MQVTKIVAAVALLSAGAAFAGTPAAKIAISSGASASKNNLKVALGSICAGDFVEFISGSNISTYVCASAGTFANPAAPTATEYNAITNTTALPFTGTAYSELRLNVNGGSFTAACLLANWPVSTKCPVADTYLEPSTGALAVPPVGSVVVGGLMDVEPAGFLSTTRAGVANPASVVTAGFAQTFGVAVSNDLYNAMFTDQLASGMVAPGCLVTDYAKKECVPMIGKPQMAAIMSSIGTNAAYSQGAQFLAPSVYLVPTPLAYERRVDTSGTQAAAQQYFLGNVCNSTPVAVVDEAAGTVGQITVDSQSTTGGVRAALNLAGNKIGIMSGENNQTGQNWKWLRVAGVSMAESALPADGAVTVTNSATAKNGAYDYWFVSRVAQPAAAGNPATFWTRVKAAFAAVPVNNTKGLFAVSETAFTKSNSCNPPAQ